MTTISPSILFVLWLAKWFLWFWACCFCIFTLTWLVLDHILDSGCLFPVTGLSHIMTKTASNERSSIRKTSCNPKNDSTILMISSTIEIFTQQLSIQTCLHKIFRLAALVIFCWRIVRTMLGASVPSSSWWSIYIWFMEQLSFWWNTMPMPTNTFWN